MLGDMLPCAADYNSADRGFGNAVLSTKGGKRYAALCVSAAYRDYYSFAEASFAMFLAPRRSLWMQAESVAVASRKALWMHAAWITVASRPTLWVSAAAITITARNPVGASLGAVAVAGRATAFALHIIMVLFSGTKEKVMRITASRAVTFMTYRLIAGVHAIAQFIRYTASAVSVIVNTTVRCRFTWCKLPVPAFIGAANIDAAPEEFNSLRREIRDGSMFNSHLSVSSKIDIRLKPGLVLKHCLGLCILYQPQPSMQGGSR